MKITNIINSPIEVQLAFNHIKVYYPMVNSVYYDKECKWIFFGDNGYYPDFDGNENINIEILETASNAIYGNTPIKLIS